MSRDLAWAGAWRKLGPEDGMGIVGGVAISAGRGDRPVAASVRPATATTGRGPAEGLGLKAEQMDPVFPRTAGSDLDVDTRPNGRVRLPRNG